MGNDRAEFTILTGPAPSLAKLLDRVQKADRLININKF
jgi:hypothetical protein